MQPKEGSYAKQMKKDHMQHHYKNGTVAFGVTQHVWDYVFGTLMERDINVNLKECKTE